MSVTTLIPAAGMGRRMGGGGNKQYLALAEKPILAHTLSIFQNHPLVDHIYVISPSDEIAYCQSEVVDRFGFNKVRALVPGGVERQDSVRNGLEACDSRGEDIVLIHDGVRPFFSPQLIEPMVLRTKQQGACVVGVPVKDTIKEVEGGRICGTPERSRLWHVQTPQAFRFDLIMEAHRKALEEGFTGTDDASLVERLGESVDMMEGGYRNIKITTPEDMVLAKAFLSEMNQGGV